MNRSSLTLLTADTIRQIDRRSHRHTQGFVGRRLDAALRGLCPHEGVHYTPAPWPLTLTGRIGWLRSKTTTLSLRIDPKPTAGDTARILIASRTQSLLTLTLIVRRGHLRQAQFGTGPEASTLTVEDWLTDPPFAALAAAILEHAASR